MHRLIASAIAIVVFVTPARGRASTWEIDPAHTSAQFAVRHLMVSTVRGEFSKVSGVVSFDDQDLSKSSVAATIDTTSLNTRVAKRDEHLKSPDFLDVAKYPTLTFTSKKVEQVGDRKFKVTGDLTIHGVTREVVREGPVWQPETRRRRDHQDQPHRLRSAMEQGARNRWGAGWR